MILNLFKISFILLVSSSAFADPWFLKVEHKTISALAIEGNILTIFSPNNTIKFERNLGGYRMITQENSKHDFIDHHGFGLDGTYLPHIHLEFHYISVIKPDLLDYVLMALGFSFRRNGQAQQILENYTNYFNLHHTAPNEQAASIEQETEEVESTTASSSTRNSTAAAHQATQTLTLPETNSPLSNLYRPLLPLAIIGMFFAVIGSIDNVL